MAVSLVKRPKVSLVKLDCAALTESHNHSDDRVHVYHGRLVPLRVCGFHASWLNTDIPGSASRTIARMSRTNAS